MGTVTQRVKFTIHSVVNLWVQNATSAYMLWKNKPSVWVQFKDILYCIKHSLYVVLLPASTSNSMNLCWHSLAFIYKQDKDILWLPRSEIQSAGIRHFGNPKCRNQHFGTSVVWLVDIRYIDQSKDRNADLDNLDTRKSITIDHIWSSLLLMSSYSNYSKSLLSSNLIIQTK